MSMTGAIEQIVQADEAAREKLAAARSEADHIRSQAERTAQEMVTAKLRELSEAVRAEEERVLTDARSQISRMVDETDRYIEELQQKKRAVMSDLIENLLKKVVEP